MFRSLSKQKIQLLPISSSSSSEEDKTDDTAPTLCSIYDNNKGSFYITSSNQCDYPIRFGSGSFEFRLEHDEITFVFHPMFLWRYIHVQKMKPQIAVQLNYTKIQTIASYHMKTPIEIILRKNNIQYENKIVEFDDYQSVLGSFNHLYRTLTRGYDAKEYMTEMLDVCFKIYVSVVYP
jgi:hypothetical protein